MKRNIYAKIVKNSFSVLEGIFAKTVFWQNGLSFFFFTFMKIAFSTICCFQGQNAQFVKSKAQFLKSKASKYWITIKKKFHQY